MKNSDDIKLMILTPQETLFEGNVEKVGLPGEMGRFMVLRNHAPVISSLVKGNVVYVSGGVECSIEILKGFVRIYDNEITVCAEV